MKLKLTSALVVAMLLSGCAATYESAQNAYDKGDLQKARTQWTELAKQGDARAMYRLYDTYSSPSNFKSDVAWLKKAAELNYPEAEYVYGIRLIDVDKKYKQGVHFITLASKAQNQNAIDFINKNKELFDWWYQAERGDSSAMLNLGDYYRNKEEYRLAAYWYEKSAKLGNESAQFKLGVAYNFGKGVNQDYKKANEWYKKSALQGSTVAAFNLGINYNQGNGTDINKKQAFYWFKKGATDNKHYYAYKAAISELGRCYLYGEGTKKDTKKAFKLLTEVASSDQYAARNLAWMYFEGDGVKQDYKLAHKWFLASANKGNSGAQYYLGGIYYEGLGTNKNYQEAIKWYELSANNGNSDAQFRLGWIYYFGKGITKDYRKAFYWYKKSAEQGYDAAQNNLAIMYENGEGVEKNQYLAFDWYKESAEQGDDVAQNNLGNGYQYGKGVTQSYQSAVYWYAKAAQQNYKNAEANLNKILYKLNNKYVTVQETAIYDKADFDSKSVKTLHQGDTVYVLSEGSSWTEVYYPQQHILGYIHNSHLS